MAVFTGPRIRTNNVYGTLTDNPLTNVATTMNSAGLENLDAVSSAHAVIVIDPLRSAGAPEIVIVTAHTGAATSATVTRGAYGTSARQHAQGVLWVHAETIDDLIRIVTSSTRPSDQYEGQLIYETDTDRFSGFDGTNWQTVAQLGAWTSYTPTLTQSGTVTKTVTYAKWIQVGKTVHCVFDLAVTGSGSAGTAVTVGLPTAASASQAPKGPGELFDTSTGTNYAGMWSGASTTTLVLLTDATGTASWGATPSVALASGDVIRGTSTYEAA